MAEATLWRARRLAHKLPAMKVGDVRGFVGVMGAGAIVWACDTFADPPEQQPGGPSLGHSTGTAVVVTGVGGGGGSFTAFSAVNSSVGGTGGSGGSPPMGCYDIVPPNSGQPPTLGLGGEDGGAGAPAQDPAEVCGCDGQHYASQELASLAGVEVDPYDYCEVPGDQFGCGPQRCALGSEGCVVTLPPHGGPPLAHECVPISDGCVEQALMSMIDPCGCLGGSLFMCRTVALGDHYAIYGALAGPD